MGKKLDFFAKLGKNCIIFSNWEFFRSIGKFFSQLRKNLVPKTRPRFIQRKSYWLLPEDTVGLVKRTVASASGEGLIWASVKNVMVIT